MLWDATFLPYIKQLQKENNCFLTYKLYKNRQWLFTNKTLKKWKLDIIQNMDLNSNKNINNKDNGDESGQMDKQSRKTFHNQREFGEKSNIQNLDIHTLFIWIFYRNSPLFVQNPLFVFAEVGEILCNLCNEPIVSVIMSCLKPFWDKYK